MVKLKFLILSFILIIFLFLEIFIFNYNKSNWQTIFLEKTNKHLFLFDNKDISKWLLTLKKCNPQETFNISNNIIKEVNCEK